MPGGKMSLQRYRDLSPNCGDDDDDGNGHDDDRDKNADDENDATRRKREWADEYAYANHEHGNEYWCVCCGEC